MMKDLRGQQQQILCQKQQEQICPNRLLTDAKKNQNSARKHIKNLYLYLYLWGKKGYKKLCGDSPIKALNL